MAERVFILPRPLFLTLISLILSVPILVLSFVDLGTVSFFLNIPAAGLTILRESTMLHIARRARPNQTPIFFSPAASTFNLLSLGTCILLCMVGFATTVYSAVPAAKGEISWGTGTNVGTIIAQTAIGPVTAFFLSINALYCTHSRSYGRSNVYNMF